jgi:two-component system, OmpR family, response regulator
MPSEERPAKPCPEVLVVDDEALVLRLLEMALPQHGLAVRQAGRGAEAVAIYRRHRDRIGVVLLDVRMPGLDGPQTLAALREVDPGVRCVFMSGDTRGYSTDELLGLGAAGVVAKPFRCLAELAGTLREVAAGQA